MKTANAATTAAATTTAAAFTQVEQIGLPRRVGLIPDERHDADAVLHDSPAVQVDPGQILSVIPLDDLDERLGQVLVVGVEDRPVA